MLNASLVTLAALLVLGGQLGDMLGRRRESSFRDHRLRRRLGVRGVRSNVQSADLVPGRQGAGGHSCCRRQWRWSVPPLTGPRRGTALGTMGGIAAVADAAGPVIGGVLTATLGWPAVFLINLPLGAIAVIIALRAIPPDVDQVRAKRVDLAGASPC